MGSIVTFLENPHPTNRDVSRTLTVNRDYMQARPLRFSGESLSVALEKMVQRLEVVSVQSVL